MTSTFDDLLRRYDAPPAFYEPLGFDYAAAQRRFRDLLPALSGVFGESLQFEDGSAIQDASFFAQVFLPRDSLVRALAPFESAVLRFSNFGDMVAVRHEDALDPRELMTLRDVLQRAGYVFVPEVALLAKYPGGPVEWVESRGATWWTRYFDWP
jgi:hypothetical protein